HTPTTDMQVGVSQILLAVEDIPAGRSQTAAYHAVVAKAVLDQIAVVGAVVRGPQDQLLSPAGAVGYLVGLVRLFTHPSDPVIVNLLVHRVRPERVRGLQDLAG